jgi:hypothetical protein
MTVIGRPSTDRPISISTSVAKESASMLVIVGGVAGAAVGGGALVVLGVVVVGVVVVVVDVVVVDGARVVGAVVLGAVVVVDGARVVAVVVVDGASVTTTAFATPVSSGPEHAARRRNPTSQRLTCRSGGHGRRGDRPPPS